MGEDLYSYFTAFGIPVVLIGVSALTKKIVRKTPFQKDDFYLGVDLTLGGVSVALVNVLDLLDTKHTGAEAKVTGSNAIWYILACFVFFILQIAFHQDWEPRGNDGKKQFLMLGFASNLIGVALLAAFMILKMRGKL